MPPPGEGSAFPGHTKGLWSYDGEAGAYYYHRYYSFEPGLHLRNPAVREEIRRVVGFWLELGVSGFRVDSAGLMTEPKGLSSKEGERHAVLKELRGFASARRGDAVFLAETDVAPNELAAYFGDGDEMQLLYNFVTNQHLFLALVRESTEPLADGLKLLPAKPCDGQWVNFLRNLDELNLGRLPKEDRDAVFEALAPERRMRIFGRGIRRRLAPMLGGDRRRIELAYSLLFSLPGTPMLVYGDEIGMGEDLSLKGREAVRTPMQWSDEPNAGFSTAPPERLAAPVVSEGEFAYRRVNVAAQRSDPGSLLNWMGRLIETRKECPEIGWGSCSLIESGDPAVFAHRCEWEGRCVFAVHNLSGQERAAWLRHEETSGTRLAELLAARRYAPIEDGARRIELAPYGYRWFRGRKRGTASHAPSADT